MFTPYFTLVVRENSRQPWAIAFGDYDRSVVKSEADAFHDDGFRRADLKILRTGELQAEIMKAVRELNAAR